jgi:dolichol-phosphate mannosyltransferase
LRRVSIIIPAYNEGSDIEATLLRIQEFVKVDFECLVVVDSPIDSTIEFVQRFAESDNRFAKLINTIGIGPAYAIRAGIEVAESNTIVVTMADGSDDARDIQELVLLIERGVHVACASRYMPTGQQIGAPAIKSILSRLAGKSLYYLSRVGTKDATNSFKAYSKDFLNQVGIDSSYGFEMGLELVAKAHRKGFLVAEIPTIWIERNSGHSKFKIMNWIPKYMKWYLVAIGLRRCP